MRAAACLLLVALLNAVALPAGANGASPLGAREASVHGEGTLQAALAGAVWVDRNATKDLGGSLALHVVAGELRIDTSRYDVYAFGAGVTPAENERTATSLAGANVTGFRLGADARILILPLGARPLAASEADGIRMAPSGYLAASFKPRVDHDPGQAPDLRMYGMGTVQAWGAPAQALRVEAPFLAVVWQADFTVYGPDGERQVTTGGESAPGAAPASAGHVDREAYITVEAGSLTLPLDAGFDVLLGKPEVALEAGVLALREPSGTLPVDGSAIPTGSRHLAFAGPLRAKLAGSDDRLAVRFLDAPAEATLDGTLVRAPGGSPGWAIALSLLALAAVPLAAKAVAEGRLRRRLAALDRLMRARSFDGALALARRIRSRRPGQEEALVAEAVGLLQARRYADAEAVLSGPFWPGALGPLRAYLRATAAAGQGRRGEARALVEACLREAPEMAGEVAANPLLATLRADGRAGGRGDPAAR